MTLHEQILQRKLKSREKRRLQLQLARKSKHSSIPSQLPMFCYLCQGLVAAVALHHKLLHHFDHLLTVKEVSVSLTTLKAFFSLHEMTRV